LKAWSGPPGPPDEPALAELEEAGIDLDPAPPGSHRHGDEIHVSDHVHPHVRSEPGDRPATGIIGGGPVGTALGLALHRAGWPILAVATRDPGRRERFQSFVPEVRAFAEPAAVLDEVELVILAVPDDVIGQLAAELRLYAGQALVHTSGLLGAEALEPAMAAGTQAGSFHPLVSIVDPERAVEDLRGATVVIDGDPDLAALLVTMADAIGAVPVALPAGAKPAYHAAAVLAAGGLVALLDAIAEVGTAAGLDERGALNVYGRLAGQTLANATQTGIGAALTGPVVRGDVGTIRRHLATLRGSAPSVVPVYVALAARAVSIAVARGSLSPDAADAVRSVLAEPG
jgi:predicted short-subunit dehydrogenase-like oxidoreductase (DUF2520 family)